MSDFASAPPAPAAPPAVETEAPTRQKRERKQTAFLGAGDADDAPARKRVEFKPGRGTKLADIPNVAFRLSKISRKDDILKFIYRVLYKGVGKQMTIKKDIGEFSGWTFANDAEREAKESLLSRAFKDTLHEILDLFEVPRGSGADGKKEAQVAASGAQMKLKKILATPLLELDIAKAIQTIEEAERENVLASLIDKATEHTQLAIQAYMHE